MTPADEAREACDAIVAEQRLAPMLAQHPMSTLHRTAWTILAFRGGQVAAARGFPDFDDGFMLPFVQRMYECSRST